MISMMNRLPGNWIKNLFYLSLVTFFSQGLSNAQEVRITAIPYTMHFENKVASYTVASGTHLRIVSPGNTDLYTTSDGGFVTNKSPRLLFRPDSSFILTAKIKLEFKSKWDAGALIIYNDSNHYAKFCFEKDFEGQQRIVTVVCNEVADDCNSMPIKGNEIYYRIAGSSKSNTFNLYYSENGEKWFGVRGFRLNRTDNLRIGFSAQSPTGDGCSVEFSEIDLQERKLKDFWKGD